MQNNSEGVIMILQQIRSRASSTLYSKDLRRKGMSIRIVSRKISLE